MKLSWCVALLAAMCSVPPAPCNAQPWPTKPLRLIVPFPAGGSTDILGRVIGESLGSALGQQVIVDNRPGANGVIGTEMAAKAPGDGYTLLMGGIGTLAINFALYSRIGYDPVRDFIAVSQIASVPNVLVVHPSLPAKSVKELIALAKARPGTLTFSSSGSGSSDHLSGELFKVMGNVDMLHIPYKGGAPAISDVIGGQVSLTFSNQPTALPHVKSGKLRGLAVTSARRSAAAPELPTISESGLAGYEVSSWHGIAVPANTPKELVARLYQEIAKSLGRPEIRERISGLAFDIVGSSPEQFSAHIRAEVAKWQKVVKQSGARVD